MYNTRTISDNNSLTTIPITAPTIDANKLIFINTRLSNNPTTILANCSIILEIDVGAKLCLPWKYPFKTLDPLTKIIVGAYNIHNIND
jgi:hypothetical protein